MPRGNQKGPQGLGPMTGRGLGRCSKKDPSDGSVPTAGDGRGLGRGVGQGRGIGRGGAGQGRNAGTGRGRGGNA